MISGATKGTGVVARTGDIVAGICCALLAPLPADEASDGPTLQTVSSDRGKPAERPEPADTPDAGPAAGPAAGTRVGWAGSCIAWG